ncbi:acyl-CoA thioesterase [Sphingomonas abietis]|uniref:Acyl-CoA thioesterase II n=1 Tax=Sphingomonas abietis TaxID=3012344 RepID=A0ABY7NII5_9SPHN|nr:acyl-CoA thioesterase II [Sphingomonas abietis]WBO21289.1 acyl-CoA thioesterase II [Sphingomonas abietis]
MSTLSGQFHEDRVADLVNLLDLERLDRDLYRGPVKPGASGRIFGGQVVAQAFMAAERSIGDGDKIAHSLHAYFLRPGDETLPVILRVERDFDGGSFASRRVIAIQNGAPLLSLTASFQRLEEGLSHSAAMPAAPPPDSLPTLGDLADHYGADWPETVQRYLRHPSAFEMRPVGAPSFLQRDKAEPQAMIWFRLRAPIPEDAALRRAILAYVSDYALLSSALIPHGISMFRTSMQTASLDHAVWFHDDAPLDQWLLYVTRSDWAGRGRGHATGTIYSQDGRMIARTAQEGLMRLRPDRPAGGTIPHTP